jgi:hypothetical protein
LEAHVEQARWLCQEEGAGRRGERVHRTNRRSQDESKVGEHAAGGDEEEEQCRSQEADPGADDPHCGEDDDDDDEVGDRRAHVESSKYQPHPSEKDGEMHAGHGENVHQPCARERLFRLIGQREPVAEDVALREGELLRWQSLL